MRMEEFLLVRALIFFCNDRMIPGCSEVTNRGGWTSNSSVWRVCRGASGHQRSLLRRLCRDGREEDGRLFHQRRKSLSSFYKSP